MLLQEVEPFFADVSKWFESILVFFNEIFSFILTLGNYILFAWFVYLFYSLYNGAKQKRLDETYVSHRLQKSKKHGRIGMIACVIIGIFFLFRILIIFFASLGSLFPPPFIYGIIFEGGEYIYIGIVNSQEISVLLVEKFFILFFGVISLICFILFTYGVFLLVYNERILHKRWKPLKLLIIGLVGLIIIGVTLSFNLMNGVSFYITDFQGYH